MPSTSSLFTPFSDRMRDAGMPEPAIAAFALHFSRLVAGNTGLLNRDAIAAVSDLPDADGFDQYAETGRDLVSRAAVIKLNGGLGTSMGLDRAKSLLPVRGDLTFLDLIAGQVLALRKASKGAIPVLLMNSFHTNADSLRALSRYPDLELDQIPLSFLQHQVPKIFADSLQPATNPAAPETEWCPPGHGDLLTALGTTGVIDRLIEAGCEYVFVSNADNLGAVLDPALLGFMASNHIDFMMEAADRTLADRKGGHLCRLTDGRLALRESAQCPPEEAAEFQDVELYRFFNTNNVWLHLPTLQKLLTTHDGALPLTTIVNRKTLDPRDPDSPPVIQLETAVGSAISLFPKAAAVRVNRRRFSPVKTTDDLLAVRSDAYRLTNHGCVVLHPDRMTPPTVALDPRYYKMMGTFETRFPCGPPSLLRCDSLEVEGDVVFEGDVVLKGEVKIIASGAHSRIAAGSVLTDTVGV